MKTMKTKRASELGGVITALVTPFQNGSVDFQSLGRLVQLQLEQGVQGFVINGTTAESPTLTAAEVKQIFQFVKSEAAGQVALIVGTGSNSTHATANFSKEVSSWGADAVLVVVPYYNKPPQRGLLAHFKAVADASPLPVILYNVPSRTITGLEPATVAELSRHPNIVGIKEASGDMSLMTEMKGASAENFIFLSGDDLSTVDFCARGGNGVISVSSHLIAPQMADFIQRSQKGELQANSEYRQRFAELMKWLFIEANPIPVKMALHWQGVLTSPELRLPLTALDTKLHKDFQACLKNLKLL